MNVAPPSYEALANLNWLQVFLFGIYPYIALVVAILGSWARFDLSQYSWKTSSSQMLQPKYMRVGSNLFHIGIITVLLGHLFGMLTPHFIYENFISAAHKQILAVVVGGIAGVVCWFRPVYAASLVEQAGIVYKLHMFLGTTLILLVPFTRLIHIISAPIWYLGRRYQIVRQKTAQ